MRVVLFVAALATLAARGSGQARLTESAHVIYREATDDYLFRARFSKPINDPSMDDLGLVFRPFGPRPGDGILVPVGQIWDDVTDGESGYLTRTIPQPTVIIDRFDPIIESDTYSVILPRSNVVQLGIAETLFPFQFVASNHDLTTNVGSDGNLRAQLNVPEPSTLAIATGSILFLVPTARRWFRRRVGAGGMYSNMPPDRR